MTKLIGLFLLEEDLAAPVEYAIILAIVGASIGLAATKLGTAITMSIQNV